MKSKLHILVLWYKFKRFKRPHLTLSWLLGLRELSVHGQFDCVNIIDETFYLLKVRPKQSNFFFVVLRCIKRFIYFIHFTFNFFYVYLPVKHVLYLLYWFNILLCNKAFDWTSKFSIFFRFAILDYFYQMIPIIHLIKPEVMLHLSDKLFWIIVVICKFLS